MAEAAVEQRPLNRFFCHQCSVDINPNLPDYTCPRCQSGFIEEITEMEEARTQHQPEESDPAAQFAELFGRSVLQSFHQLDTDRAAADSDSDLDEQDLDPVTASTGRIGHFPRHGHFPFGMAGVPGARIAIRTRQGTQDGGMGAGEHRNHALQSILQSILSGLVGGAVPGANQGGNPFGGMFSMYGNPADYAWGTGGLDNIITQLLNQMEGTGPPPAGKDDIEKLRHVDISKTETERGIQCSVCMEDFQVGETARGLPCEHLYHEPCILPWLELHGTCPVCRKSVSEATSPATDSSSSDPASSSSTQHTTSRSSRSSSRSRNQGTHFYEDDFD